MLIATYYEITTAHITYFTAIVTAFHCVYRLQIVFNWDRHHHCKSAGEELLDNCVATAVAG